jgi:hypothetical protein
MKRLPASPLLLALAVGLVVAAISATGALALFTKGGSVGSNTFAADTLNAPTSLTAGGGASITLNWTATTDTYADGHRVFRSSTPGGPYSQIAEVTPRTTTNYADSPAAGTYYYVVRAFSQNWESADSNEDSATTP